MFLPCHTIPCGVIRTPICVIPLSRSGRRCSGQFSRFKHQKRVLDHSIIVTATKISGHVYSEIDLFFFRGGALLARANTSVPGIALPKKNMYNNSEFKSFAPETGVLSKMG